MRNSGTGVGGKNVQEYKDNFKLFKKCQTGEGNIQPTTKGEEDASQQLGGNNNGRVRQMSLCHTHIQGCGLLKLVHVCPEWQWFKLLKLADCEIQLEPCHRYIYHYMSNPSVLAIAAADSLPGHFFNIECGADRSNTAQLHLSQLYSDVLNIFQNQRIHMKQSQKVFSIKK